MPDDPTEPADPAEELVGTAFEGVGDVSDDDIDVTPSPPRPPGDA
jgi:hypothetical protein